MWCDRRLVLGLLGAAAIAPVAGVAELASPASQEILASWHGRLDRRHFSARMRLELSRYGMDEVRVLRVFRADDEASLERLLVRFEGPADLRDVRLLYREVSGRSNEYFLYTPSTRRVRRLPPSVADDDLYGVDLEFLGFGVAETEPTEVLTLEPVQLDGRDAYRLRERAVERNPRFDERITWLDRETFVALQTELYRAGALRLSARVLELREIDGVLTPVRMRFVHPLERREVLLHVDAIDYTTALPDEVFSVLDLSRARGTRPR